MRVCWCGNGEYDPFSAEYCKCSVCGTLVSVVDIPIDHFKVLNDETDFYGKKYWFEYQQEVLGFEDIHSRARSDLTERNLYWLKALLKYRLPPAKILELGCSHGSFVALLRQAGYDASGVELSPWVVKFAQKTFDVPVSVGPVETLEIQPCSIDVIVLMDVLEHLPDPIATISHCLELLKQEGILLIQTPQFKENIKYAELVEVNDPFVELLKGDEHIYLFSEQSARCFFKKIGADHIMFEPAIFGHYDMFFTVSRKPMSINAYDEIEAALLNAPRGRLALGIDHFDVISALSLDLIKVR